MQNEYAAGDAVVVFDGIHWRSRAEHGDPQAPDGRAGVIVRDVTQVGSVYNPRTAEWEVGQPVRPFQYEVKFANGESAFVSIEHMAPVAQLAAAQAAAHERARAEASAATDHAQALSDGAVALRQ